MPKNEKGRAQRETATGSAPPKAPPSSTAPTVTPPAEPATRALESLRDAFEGLRADVTALTSRLASESVVLPIRDALARDLRSDLEASSRAAHASLADGLGTLESEQRARLTLIEGLVADVRDRLLAGDARIVALDARVTDSRISEAVRASVNATADRVFEEQFQARLEELTSAFADADDRFGQLRAYIDQFGPGGLPVLKQENVELQGRLTATIGEAAALRARVAELEAAAIRQRVEHGIDPALVDERLRTIGEKDRSIADRESLTAENLRLESQIEKLKAELARWVALERGQQEARADKAQLARLEREREEAHEARTRAETERIRAGQLLVERERELEKLRRSLSELETDRASAKERVARIEALNEEKHALQRQYEDAAAESSDLRRELRDAEGRLAGQERQILKLQSEQANAEVAWRRAYAEAQRAETERVRGELEKWAQQAAETRSAAVRAEADRLARDGEELRKKLEIQAKRLAEAELARDQHAATVGRLQLDRAALDGAVERHKLLLDAEIVAHRARLEAQLAQDAESIRADAAAQGEREREAAQADADQLTAHADRLQANLATLDNHRVKLETTLAELGGQKGGLEAELEELRRRIVDLRDRDLPEEERTGSLRKPWFNDDALPEIDSPREDVWLDTLTRGIAAAGFVFHPRLLRAFHTSLKVAHHAPLTVLSGISGTGKSELPRLYADLGGLPFLELAVQPSWDSPHDLFGFFNYTDGRLKAEPLAQLLAQVGEPAGRLSQSPLLVLLDEMNLARVEYYFAELLSKLEARRGVRRFGDEAARRRASVLIDVGPGQPKIPLYLDERVMFAGTMNQDESTLTLSDKVLDRSCLLTFPAPHTLEMREQKRVQRRSHRLSWEAWQSWVKEPTGNDDHTDRLNKLNEVMGSVERPFGHRLFRAIHAYVANYPGETDHAWSDQFAMKVLPRLRGLETGDRRVRAALDQIASQVPSELSDSFEAARDREFFAWSGASELYRAGR